MGPTQERAIELKNEVTGSTELNAGMLFVVRQLLNSASCGEASWENAKSIEGSIDFLPKIMDAEGEGGKKRSIYDGAADADLGPEEELFTVLAESEHVKIERIISEKHKSPEGFWYDQDQSEWVCVLEGSAVLAVDKGSGAIEIIRLLKGDHILIPAHQRHRVEETSLTEKTIWLAVFF
jgi:cupin 2 domain-containing protein